LHSPAANVPVDQHGKTDNGLLGPFSLLYFADFDQDGRQGLAIRNGNDPTQRYKPMFDVYLQDPQTQRWVINAPLTKLAWETSSGMFSLSPSEGILLSQVDRDCCWTRSTRWKMRNGERVRLSAYTQEEVPPTEFGGNSSMPRGYTGPMETENLIIVREPLAPPSNGPYHIQLVKNFAVIEHNSAPDNATFFTGMYRKQPAQP